MQRLGIADLQVTPDPVCIATEGALWGAVADHGFLREAVIVSDDAGQVNIGLQRAAQAHMRALIWWFYADLKAYRADPGPRRRGEMRARFDRIFARRTGFAALDRLLARLHANKPELLMVLDRPEIPLHTNGSERDIRCQVIKPKISGGTRSDAGRDCRDAFLGLMHTCAKLGIAFWEYLGDRIGIANQAQVPAVADLIGAAAGQPNASCPGFCPGSPPPASHSLQRQISGLCPGTTGPGLTTRSSIATDGISLPRRRRFPDFPAGRAGSIGTLSFWEHSALRPRWYGEAQSPTRRAL